MTDAPERIWADPPQVFDGMDCWHSTPHESRTEYIRADKVAALVEALAWYGEQSRLARLIHSEGDAGRNAIAADGGDKARAVLAAFKGGADGRQTP